MAERETPGSLSGSQPSHRDLVEHSLGLICMHDLDGVLEWVNPASATLFGYEPAQMVGRNLRDFLAEPEIVRQYIEKVRANGEDQGWMEVLTREGEPRFLRFHNVLVQPDDRPAYVLGHAQDVTDLVRAQQELQAAREQVDRLVAASPAMIFSADVSGEGGTTFMSSNVRRLMGYEPEDFRGSFWVEHVHPEDRERVRAFGGTLLSRGHNRMEYRFLHADGTYHVMKDEQRVLRDQTGRPVEIAGYWIDVTGERRTAEEAERFFKASSDLMCVANFEGYFTRVNPAFFATLGFEEKELLARPFLDFVHPEDVASTLRELETLGQGSRTISFDNRYRCVDGSYRWLQWNATPYSDEGLIYAVAREISDLKEREAELREAKLVADRASAAKGEFLANVSHEIRTPMNGIIGMTELTLDTPLNDQQREYMQMVQSSAMALLDVINSVLDFSKIEADKLRLEAIDFTLRDTLAGALKPLALVANRRNIELLYDEGPGIPDRLRGDPGRLRQVLVNLIGNAVKFTEQGEVRLSIEAVDETEQGIALRFEVSDTGIGIHADKLDYIFESFSQADGSTSRRYGGTGLGLTIASGIVSMMGGKIRVESQEGVGSRFYFTARFQHGQQAARPPKLPSKDLRGVRALVVDDNETNRRILQGFLHRMEIDAVCVASGVQALSTLAEARVTGQPFQMTILDVHMPVMDGFELARRIRGDPRFDDLVLVTITSAGRPGDGALCEELGIASYLLKPITPTELRDAIQLTMARDHSTPGEAELVTRHSLREAWHSLRVLLAEDNTVNQKLAVHVLGKLGHTVQLAANGREALALLEEAEFDLVLMDIQMPEMGGIEATALIRKREAIHGGHIPIVAMTAHAMAGDRERFLAAGMDEYISKPISQERLREVVRNLGRPSPGQGLEGARDGAAPLAEAPSSTPATPEPLPFDRDALMARVESDVDLLSTLVAVFKADRPGMMAEIEEALAAGDAVALADTAHTMKGALSVFGVEPARSIAERLEAAGRQNQLDSAPDLYDELGRAIVVAEDGLEAFLAQLV